MNRLLNALGLMTRAEHDREVVFYVKQAQSLRDETDQYAAKYKKAITDLAAAREEVTRLNSDALSWVANMGQADDLIAELRAEVESLRPDALAMRRKRAMDRDRKKGKTA